MNYGICPFCKSPVVNRERRLNGNDTCAKGHVYPMTETTTAPVTVAVYLGPRENAAVLELCREKNLSAQELFIQALRTYQLADHIFKKTGKLPLEGDLT